MSQNLFVFYYLLMALLVGFCAIGRKPGFLVMFLLSILITPFLGLLLLYVVQRIRGDRRRDTASAR
jgi:4-hydroxybenzoate polyprenyltransferase